MKGDFEGGVVMVIVLSVSGPGEERSRHGTGERHKQERAATAALGPDLRDLRPPGEAVPHVHAPACVGCEGGSADAKQRDRSTSSTVAAGVKSRAGALPE